LVIIFLVSEKAIPLGTEWHGGDTNRFWTGDGAVSAMKGVMMWILYSKS
jgi:hypothetical protein